MKNSALQINSLMMIFTKEIVMERLVLKDKQNKPRLSQEACESKPMNL